MNPLNTDPMFGQIMFMHAQVNFRDTNSNESGHPIFSKTTTLWPLKGGVKHESTGGEVEPISLEIAHFTCLQTNSFPSNVKNCFCQERDEESVTLCKLDHGMIKMAEAIERFLEPP